MIFEKDYLFTSLNLIEEKIVTLKDKEALHLKEKEILPGMIITIHDKNGSDFRARVVSITKDEAVLKIFDKLKRETEPLLNIFLLQALIKKEKFDFIIEKSTELGVFGIIPIETKKSQRIEEFFKNHKKIHRWPFVAVRATLQSRRAAVPRITKVVRLKEAIDMISNFDHKILISEKENNLSLKEYLIHNRSGVNVAILVGPEGGWDDEEIKMINASGFVSTSLGPRILRVETATIAAISIIQAIWGDI